MKKEINGSEIVYLISLFCMPVITFIGVVMLLNMLIKMSNTLTIDMNDLSITFFREIALFLSCWMLLFSTYIFHKVGSKVGHICVITISIGILIYAIYASINSITSIANIINPIIVGASALYGLLKPLPEKTVKKRKDRVKNTLEKYTKVETKKTAKSKSNKK